ncbi:hypothetical protein D9M71_584120 [compost metagenome]
MGQAAAEALDDLRHPVADTQAAALVHEVDERQVQHLGVDHGLEHAQALYVLAALAVTFQFGDQPVLFCLGQPLGLLGLVGQEQEAGHAEEHGRHAFEEQHPAPAAPVQPLDVVHDPGGKRRTDDVADRNRRSEQGHGGGQLL